MRTSLYGSMLSALVLTGAGAVDPGPVLAPHVTDLGYVSEEDKYQAMAGALAFIHPSAK